MSRAEGEAAATEAIERGQSRLTQAQTTALLDVLHACCRTFHEFTTDQVTIMAEVRDIPIPGDPRVLGGIMRRGAKNGWCGATNKTRKSILKQAHVRPKTVWQSLIKE